jgi:hypothetical protein
MAFTLQLQLLTANAFPFPLLGLVHLHNRIEVLRPLGIDGLRFACMHRTCRRTGGTFDLVTEAEDGLGLLWRETSRMLVRGLKLDGSAQPASAAEPAEPEATRWYADSDIGRRYAKVCGDYNPIHLSAASARLFGFPTAIAHGMWSKAMAWRRCGAPAEVAMASKWISTSRCGCRRRWCSVPVRRASRELRLDGHGGRAAHGGPLGSDHRGAWERACAIGHH